jgi:hypothetical protein
MGQSKYGGNEGGSQRIGVDKLESFNCLGPELET